MEQLSLALRTFNERVRTMNQTNGKVIMLTAQEARSLHQDIFSLLANMAEITSQAPEKAEIMQINMDGGGFT